MSDNFRINDIFNRLKSNLVRDSQGSGNFAIWGNFKGKKKFQEEEKDKDPFFNSSEFEKLFNLGESLGLNKNEVKEALELILKATAQLPKNTDVSTVLLSNNLIKYPVIEHHDDMISKIPGNLLNEIKTKSPELYLAITNPFEFMCKHPKTVSLETYKSFSYQKLLEFNRLCPEEHKILSQEAYKEIKDDTTSTS